MPIHALAESQDISAKYLEQLLIPLKESGLVKSVRGAKGGYLLARDAAHITLYDIVVVLEGPVTAVECVENPDACSRVGGCVVHLLWGDLSRLMQDFLAGVTLADLVERSKRTECEVKSVVNGV